MCLFGMTLFVMSVEVSSISDLSWQDVKLPYGKTAV